jgi:hypothetical protein
MAYTNRPITETAVVPAVADYHDRIRWGSILAGLVVALVPQLMLGWVASLIGGAVGARSPRTMTTAYVDPANR